MVSVLGSAAPATACLATIGPIEGTVVPGAAAGSLPFLPQPCLRVLHEFPEGAATGLLIRTAPAVALSRRSLRSGKNPILSRRSVRLHLIETWTFSSKAKLLL
jgi:hypothetical protein